MEQPGHHSPMKSKQVVDIVNFNTAYPELTTSHTNNLNLTLTFHPMPVSYTLAQTTNTAILAAGPRLSGMQNI